MIWKECLLMAKEKTGEDPLGNAVYGYREVRRTNARFTPWTDGRAALEGREVTKNEQLYLIPIPFREFPSCQRAVLDGHPLDITKTTDLSPRFTEIQVKSYRG